MATNAELNDALDLLQQALDTEQAQIQASVDALNVQIDVLEDLVAQGGTVADRQALLDKIIVIKNDLEATIPDVEEPVEPEPE